MGVTGKGKQLSKGMTKEAAFIAVEDISFSAPSVTYVRD